MTTENQNENIESNIVDSAENEGLTQEQLESVAGGRRLHPNLPKKPTHVGHQNRNHRHGTQD